MGLEATIFCFGLTYMENRHLDVFLLQRTDFSSEVISGGELAQVKSERNLPGPLPREDRSWWTMVYF